jgi:hypothetical protein
MLYFLLAFCILLQILDICTTKKVLRQKGKEMNPIVLWIMNKTHAKWWHYKIGIAIIALGLILLSSIIIPVWSMWSLVLVSILYLLTIFNNLKQIKWST